MKKQNINMSIPKSPMLRIGSNFQDTSVSPQNLSSGENYLKKSSESPISSITYHFNFMCNINVAEKYTSD